MYQKPQGGIELVNGEILVLDYDHRCAKIFKNVSPKDFLPMWEETQRFYFARECDKYLTKVGMDINSCFVEEEDWVAFAYFWKDITNV